MTDVVALAAELLAIPSLSGSEKAVVDFVSKWLVARGWNVTVQEVSKGRGNVWASRSGGGVAFSTHLDTVPPHIPPRLEKDKLYGRGACDAKGIAAAMICAAERLRISGMSLGLLFVVGEETTHDGAVAANLVPTKSRVLINGEPTESTLALGTKGALRLTIRTHGEAAHSAYPELGHSATRALVNLLAELDDLELPRDGLLGETTVNIGRLSGGIADNVIAPEAEARLMIRLVTDEETVMKRITDWVGERATIVRGAVVPPVKLGSVDGFRTSIAAYATDIPKLTKWGTPYLYGPGSIHVAHRDDEHVNEPELMESVGAYERLVTVAKAR